jgi:hypothetical protein
MLRRVESLDAASRRGRGEDDARAASQPAKLGEAALQSAPARVFPGRLMVGRPPLQVRQPRSES